MSEWLIGITAAAMLTAVARCLMPTGAVQQVGSLVCAMLLLWAVLKPLAFLTTSRTQGVEFGGGTEQIEVQLRQQNEQLLKSLIEQECEAYIVDKAAKLGADCTAQVTCRMDDAGTWTANHVRVDGTLSAQQRRELEQIISADLGVERSGQAFSGGG